MGLILLLSRIYFDLLMVLAYVFVEVPLLVLRYFKVIAPRRSECLPKDGTYKSVLITGASVGIGAGLARQFAKPGVHLVLTAYTKPSLEPITKECQELGATVVSKYVDVKNKEKMDELIKETNKGHPLDLVIANAGVVPTVDGLKESHWVFETNLLGTLNTVVPAIEVFRANKRGQICLLSSLGSYAPATNFFMLPYVATKTTIRSYSEGLRLCLAPENIGITVVCPGFVESRMTAKQAKLGISFMGLWTNKEACDVIVDGIRRNLPEVAFPSFLYIIVRLMGNMPLFFRELIGQFIGSQDPFADMEQRNRNSNVKMGLTEDTIPITQNSIISNLKYIVPVGLSILAYTTLSK